MASFEHFMTDSREASLIVHLLLSLQMCHSHPAPVTASFTFEMLGRAEHRHSVGTWYVFNVEMECNYLCSSLELGGVAVVWRDHHRQVTNGVSNLKAIITKLKATCLPALLAPEAHVFPKLQPPLFLFRQHISPQRVVHAAAPLHTIQTTHTKKATHTHVSRLSHFVIPPFPVAQHGVGRTFLRHQFLMGRERYRTHDPEGSQDEVSFSHISQLPSWHISEDSRPQV